MKIKKNPGRLHIAGPLYILTISKSLTGNGGNELFEQFSFMSLVHLFHSSYECVYNLQTVADTIVTSAKDVM